MTDPDTIQTTLAQKRHPKSERPGPGRPTQRQIEERNRELLDCAFEMFVERGFEGTAVSDITDRVGMAKRTVYTRYGDKATLFTAAVQRALGLWLLPPERMRECETDDLEETLVNLAMMWAQNIMSPLGKKLVQVTNTESYRNPLIGRLTVERGREPLMAYLTNLFHRRIDEFDLDPMDIEDAARSFISSIGVLPVQWAGWGLPEEEEIVHQRVRRRVRWFLRGVLHG